VGRGNDARSLIILDGNGALEKQRTVIKQADNTRALLVNDRGHRCLLGRLAAAGRLSVCCCQKQTSSKSLKSIAVKLQSLHQIDAK
jgi:hypothetical protein